MSPIEQVKADALQRALRTFVAGLGIDLAVAAAMVIGVAVAGWGSWGDVQWGVLSFSLAKSITQAVVAYVMRRWANKAVPNSLQV